MVFKFLFVLLFFFGSEIPLAQNMSSEELIKKWNTKDVFQTVEAEKTYSDLKLNYNSTNYKKIVSEIKNFLKENDNPRIEVRLKMYELLDYLQQNDRFTLEKENELHDLFQKTVFLKDEQILSEVYSLYAENSGVSFEDNLFYILKSIDIQQKIGTKYFPKFYMRLFFAGSSYYNLSMYRESIQFIQKSQENLGSAENNLGIYVLNMDLLGASYYHLRKIDSGNYYYQQIYKQLRHYNTNYTNYKENFKSYNSVFFNVWLGISQGGIAKGLVMQKKYEEAIPYLEYNISQSLIHNQPNDVAKAENLLAEIYTNLNKKDVAFQYRWSALKNAAKRKTLRESIIAAQGLEELYKEKNKFDSAYFYNEQKHLYEREMFQSINHSKFLSVTNRLQHESMQNTIIDAENKITEQKLTRNLILVISVILLSVVLFFYYRFRQKQQIKLLKLNQKKEIAEKNYLESQEIIKNANDQLLLFRQRLNHNNVLIETLKNGSEKSASDYSELHTPSILTKEDWIDFKKQFNKVYPNYFYMLREIYPQFSQAEIRYLCLVKLNLRQNEIAAALGISDSSIRVTWHRMRKKMETENPLHPEEFLKDFENKYSLKY